MHTAQCPLDKITHIRVCEEDGHSPLRLLLLEESTHPIVCCEDLPRAEIDRVAHLLSGMLRFSCHSVHVIIFGNPAFLITDRSRMLQNPGVSELTAPFLCLERLVIYTASYESLLLERFMTYAVNYLGTKYLKTSVTVYVYGKRDTLPSNVWNALHHLFKTVTVQTDSLSVLDDTE